METRERKILIVDDHLEFVELVRRFLEREGYQTFTALNGKEAIEKTISESPELVLLDLKLPDLSGDQILKRIKEIKNSISVIMITGYGREQLAVDLMKAGAIDYLSKPIERESLLKAVKDAFKIHDAQIEEEQKVEYSSLERFFPFFAHEIRNPLHAIGGALAIIQRRSNLEDEFLARSIKIIQEEIGHLNEFVQDSLDFIRSPMPSRFIEVEINEVISVVLNRMSHMVEGLPKKIRVTTEMHPELPKIYGNYEEIKQAFLNIVKNAYEAMSDGEELIIQTHLKSENSSECIEIIFIDKGSGIKKEDTPNLFTPFFSTKPRGTGLGLVISKRIIAERHQGRIQIESEVGKGTRVKVQLPVVKGMAIFEEKQV